MQILHYYHTLKHLKLGQIIHQIKHKITTIRPLRTGTLSSPPYSKAGSRLQLLPSIDKSVSYRGNDRFIFLNKESIFRDWDDKQQGMLWAYNLNYMDFLLQKGLPFSDASAWINRFIDALPHNRTGMEPYPTALRGINWIKCFARYSDLIAEEEQSRWDTSLFAQYYTLYNSLEYHLLGNHLLEDAFSLLWGGLYFRESKFYEKAVWLLTKELKEQILPDGAHYELSPMYHAILLDRQLDCINALNFNIRFEGQEDVILFLEEKARHMLGWLHAIVYKDGSIPLLNDAAYGIAPTSAEIFDYAKRLGIRYPIGKLKECGYRKFISSRFEMILDVGKIGPDYIPGHAHADTFSYELRIDGKPFIIDTGISTYDKNARRQYERETQAHNTVNIDGLSSSEVWGGFRVARRAAVTYLKEYRNSITACHNGFKQLGIEHQRIFHLNRDEILISDSLLPATGRKAINTIILHPAVSLLSVGPDSIQTDCATLTFYGADELWIEDCQVAFEYNRLLSTKKICIAFTNQMQYAINVLTEEAAAR